MKKSNFVVGFLIILCQMVSSQRVIDGPCNLQSTGLPGVCKLLLECPQIRDDIIKTQQLPQTCGFQGTHPIVCCPINGIKRAPGVISKTKCKNYSSYAFEKSSECGHKIVKRIVGGEVASRKEFAHMAIIGFEEITGEIEWSCGGSIISEQYILTAGRCLFNPTHGSPKYVELGITRLNDTDHKQSFKVADAIRHPNYSLSSRYNDIGLLKLNKPINLNSYARPACLYTEQEISVETAVATGWGAKQWGDIRSETLLKVRLNFIDHESCNMSYSRLISKILKYGILRESQICAGSGDETERDTCLGDTGGPLQIYHEGDDINCMYDIVGITSFGKSCSGIAGVYTKVSHYVQWIEDTVWPTS